MSRWLESWGTSVYRFRWPLVILWTCLILLGVFFGTKLETRLSGYGWDVKGSQSFNAQKLVAKDFTGRGPTALVMVVRDSRNRVGSEEYSRNLGKLLLSLKSKKTIENIYSWLDAPQQTKPGMVGKDGFTSIAYIGMNISEEAAVDQLSEMQEKVNLSGQKLGLKAYLVGTSALWADVNVQSQAGLVKVEMFVLPIVFIVLLLVFRSLVSAGTTFIVTVFSVLVGMGAAYFFTLWFNLSIFIVNTIVMLGLGLGIDYALFIVSRFKSELFISNDPKKSISIALSTSGHTVLFSGITVLFAVASIFIVPLPAIRSLALGAVIAVSISLLSGLTLLPPILLLLGKHINKGKLSLPCSKLRNSNFWYFWSHSIMKKPILFIIIVVAGLLTLAVPALDLKTFTPDSTILPNDSPVKKGFIQLEQSFGTGYTSAISIVIHSNGSKITQSENMDAINELYIRINQKLNKEFESIQSLFSVFSGMNALQISDLLEKHPEGMPLELRTQASRFINQSGDTLVIDINPKGSAASLESRKLVKTLKGEILSYWNAPKNLSAYIGGATSQGMDMNSAIQDNYPVILALMLLLCYLVLLMTFKSVLLPLKAILMNLLSVAATYGVLVFVFARGHGAGIFSIQPNGYIQNYIPLLLLTLLFSLSTDYEVFLLNSIKEEYHRTRNNTDSVAVGLEKTAPIITSAAILMVIIFGGFAFSNMLPIQSLGFGMSVAIIIDASIVRFVLVPATMRLLGNWNWWFPGTK